MKFAQVRLHAMSLPEVTEEPHHHFSSFRVRGKVFVTVPPGEEHLHIFVDKAVQDEAIAAHPEFIEKLLWGGKVVGLRVTLTSARPALVKELVAKAWAQKGSSGGSRRSKKSTP